MVPRKEYRIPKPVDLQCNRSWEGKKKYPMTKYPFACLEYYFMCISVKSHVTHPPVRSPGFFRRGGGSYPQSLYRTKVCDCSNTSVDRVYLRVLAPPAQVRWCRPPHAEAVSSTGCLLASIPVRVGAVSKLPFERGHETQDSLQLFLGHVGRIVGVGC